MQNILFDALNLILERPLAFLFAILLFILIWIYKELRNKYIENQKYDAKRTDEAIALYSELELEIHKYLERRTEDYFLLYEKISKVNSHLPIKIYSLAKKCKVETEESRRISLLENLRIEINNEIDFLKDNQMDSVTRRNESLIDKTKQFTHNTLKPFVVPIIDLYLIIVILLVLVLVISFFLTLDTFEKQIFMISLTLAFITYVMSIYLVNVYVIKKNKFPSNIYDRIWFVLFIIIPPFLIILYPVWYVGIGIIIIIISYMGYIAKKVQRMNQNTSLK